MKRQRLQIDFEFDFDVYGIVSTYKDYKLAWNLNKNFHINLRKEEDFTINFVDNQLVVSHFRYATDGSVMQLLRNKSYQLSGGENQYIIPEMPKIDYFVMVQGEVSGHSQKQILSKLRKTDGVEYAMEIDIEKLKSRENLIF